MKVNVLKINDEMTVKSGLITVSDPSYNDDVLCAVKNIKVKPGNYSGFAHISKIRSWGKRVIVLQIIHNDFILEPGITHAEYETKKWEHIGNAAVDSALMAIFESGKKKNYEQDEWIEFCDKIQNKDYLFIDGMFVSSSGIGDGYYPVYALKKDGQIISIAVDFLEHPWLYK